MLVHHHVKYKEIHGVDEVVLMEKGEHTRLHIRLRREGKCNIPSEDLHKLSVSAYMRREDVRKRFRIDILHLRFIYPLEAPIALLSAGFGLERRSAMPYLTKKS